MTRHTKGRLVGTALCLAVAAAACGGATQMSVAETTGPAPTLPPPKHSLIPTVNVVKASPWPEGSTGAAPGLDVRAFARGLDHPRWLYVLPNGDVLVAETNAPPRPDDGKGVKGWFFKRYQKKAGGAVPSANRITLLRDTDGDGTADVRTAFLTNLNSPFGMALVGDVLYVANTDAVVRFPYTEGATRIAAAPVKLVDLPGGTLNITGRRTSSPAVTAPSCTPPSGPTAMWRRTASRKRKGAPPSGRSISAPVRTASSRAAFAIRWAWRGSPRRARCGWWSTNVTSSATTSSRTT
jgi:glucose/arabinose dehydrogenase